jgi:hypothetical protein
MWTKAIGVGIVLLVVTRGMEYYWLVHARDVASGRARIFIDGAMMWWHIESVFIKAGIIAFMWKTYKARRGRALEPKQ